MAVKTSAGHTQYKFSLHFIASPHTPKTIDAFGKIRSHVWMTQILFIVQVIFSFRISDIPDADAGGYSLQFTVIIDLAGETI